jgi:hypothetical protein
MNDVESNPTAIAKTKLQELVNALADRAPWAYCLDRVPDVVEAIIAAAVAAVRADVLPANPSREQVPVTAPAVTSASGCACGLATLGTLREILGLSAGMSLTVAAERLKAENVNLQRQVDELQARGTEFMLERQRWRDPTRIAAIARKHLFVADALYELVDLQAPKAG